MVSPSAYFFVSFHRGATQSGILFLVAAEALAAFETAFPLLHRVSAFK
jgi:hypothetical protein